MVEMTTAIKLYIFHELNLFLDIPGCFRFVSLLQQSVEVVHIGTMVLSIVKLHKMTANYRLKRSNLKRQMLKLNLLFYN